MEPLKGLDDIDWQNLEHHHSSAADVPQNIRALLSTDPDVWKEAYCSLLGSLSYQRTVYNATTYAIPFLVELLQYDFVINRHCLLFELLPALADGYSKFDAHYHFDPPFFDKMLAEMGTDFQTQRQKELDDAKKARQAILAYTHIYESLLNHQEPKILTGAIYLLSQFPELSTNLFPRLQALYAQDKRIAVRNSILHAVRKLNIPVRLKNDFFEPIYDQETNHLLKAVAALGAFEAQGANYRSDIFNFLVNFSQELEESTKYGWLSGDSWDGPQITVFEIWDGPKITIFQIVGACVELSSVSNVSEVRQVALRMKKPPRVFEIVKKLLFKLYASEVAGREFHIGFSFLDVKTRKPVRLTETPHSIPERYKLLVNLALELDKFWEVESNMLNLLNLPHSKDELKVLKEASN